MPLLELMAFNLTMLNLMLFFIICACSNTLHAGGDDILLTDSVTERLSRMLYQHHCGYRGVLTYNNHSREKLQLGLSCRDCIFLLAPQALYNTSIQACHRRILRQAAAVGDEALCRLYMHVLGFVSAQPKFGLSCWHCTFLLALHAHTWSCQPQKSVLLCSCWHCTFLLDVHVVVTKTELS